MTGNHLVAGIGFRHGVAPDAIVALLRKALAESAPEGRLVAIATAADRAGEAAIRDAAAAFGLLPIPVEPDALERVDSRVQTRSARIETLRGVGSLAEAAALAGAGETGHLIRTRIDDGQVTCALAVMGVDATTEDGTSFPRVGGREPPVRADRAVRATGPEQARPPSEPRRGPPSSTPGGGKRFVANRGGTPTPEHAETAQIVTATA